MDVQAPVVFLRCFSGLTDPRRHNVRHLFADILAIAILADFDELSSSLSLRAEGSRVVMSRSDDWEEVVLYGQANQQWLGEILDLPNGIPCADTFSRLFARINPDAFEKCFIQWTQSLASSSDGRLVAIDGKTLRHSFVHGWNKQMTRTLMNDIALDQARGLNPE
jgi:hypothetical protein